MKNFCDLDYFECLYEETYKKRPFDLRLKNEIESAILELKHHRNFFKHIYIVNKFFEWHGE